MPNKVSELPDRFYWKFKPRIVDYSDAVFASNLALCCYAYKDFEDWSLWTNGQHSSEYNHALFWLWTNEYIYVLPSETFDNFVLEEAYNYDTKRYELTSEDYKWLTKLMFEKAGN